MTVAQLATFRYRCPEFNAFFIAHQPAIVRGILKNPFYYTTWTLCSIIPPTEPLAFGNLTYVARRCDIAETLASSIAEYHVGQGPATTIRMAKNIKPYLLSLGHFFENHGQALANFSFTFSDPWLRPPGIKSEIELLTQDYNEQTVQRICLTYKLLKQILCQKLSDGWPSIRRFTPIPAAVGMLTFGGLEMIKDIVTHPRLNDRLKYVVSYFAKATSAPVLVVGGQALAALPPSFLGPRLTIDKILRIGLHALYVLDFRLMEMCGFPRVDRAEEVVRNQNFLEYLKSYDGEEPKLLR